MKKKTFTLEVPGDAKRVLLHTCCAPCSSAIIECLIQHDIRPTIYYCNPNIYPLEEYNIRKMNVPVMPVRWDSISWMPTTITKNGDAR